MSTIYNIIPHEIISSIGWTLLHSLWQGAVISVILYITLYFMRGKSANAKAIISTCSLLLLFAAAIVTYTIEYNTASMPETNPAGFMNEAGIHNYNTGSSVAGLINGGTNILSNAYSEFKMFFAGHINLIFTLWLAGLFLFAIRLFGGLFYLARIRRKVAIVEDSRWNDRIKDICKKINLKIKISLAESSHTKVPVVIGYFKPVILFPFGLLTGLPAEHIEAILAHEIAHLKRYDLVINLLQSVAEVIFFYNPFVWWISNRIRIEREYCCDDIAIELCGNELVYAKALVSLESMIESNMPLFAIPLFKNKNQLLKRIKRMLHKQESPNNFKEKFTAVIIFIGVLITAAVFKNVNATTLSQETRRLNASAIELPSAPQSADYSTFPSLQEAEMKKQDKEWAEHEKNFNAFTAEMKQKLFKAGIKNLKNNYSFILDSKKLMINYKKMTDELRDKALKLYKKHFKEDIGEQILVRNAKI